MKMFSLLLSLLLSFNLFASTTDLGNLIDEHQFFLTVEWDQKDQNILANKEKVFAEKFAQIARRENVTQEDILKLMEQRTLSPELVKRLRMRLSLLPLNPGPDAIKKFVEDARSDLYAKGASWNGDATTVGIALALVIITVGAAYLAINGKKDVDCHYDANSYGCKSPGTYVCTDWGQEYRCSTSSYTDTYGQTRTQESCGYYDACVGGYYK